MPGFFKGRGGMGLLGWAFALAILSTLPPPSDSSLSGDDDYKLIFSEGIAFPSEEARLYYTSARKFQETGDAKSAASLYQRLSSPPLDASVRAAALARQAEMASEAGRKAEAANLASEALSVCIAGAASSAARRKAVLDCGVGWVGWGFGSCCPIAAMAGRALQGAGRRGAALAAMTLARRLTPSYRPPPPPLVPSRGLPRKKVVLVFAASGSYTSFVAPLVASARKHFLPQHDVSYIAFTDDASSLASVEGVTLISRPDLGWPLSAMLRYRHYADSIHLFAGADYAFSIDVDCLFVAPVGDEVLASTVGTAHADSAHYDGTELLNSVDTMPPSGQGRGKMWLQSESAQAASVGFEAGDAVYERRNSSRAHIPVGEGVRYYYSGFYGGTTRRFASMVREMARATEADVANGVVARVHDESHINRYWLSHPPEVVLSASYMYPEAAVLRDTKLCRPKEWCPRDHMHPWLWAPWRPREWDAGRGWTPGLWGSAPVMVPRVLNLAKDKRGLIEARWEAKKQLRYLGWSSDLHIGPIGDVKGVLRALGVEVLDKSLSAHCASSGTCAHNLRVLNFSSVAPEGGGGGTGALAGAFYEEYRLDREMAGVDFFICIHPAALCEVYEGLGRGMVVYATTRFDLGKLESSDALEAWSTRLAAMASRPDVAVLANNAYDAAYIEYFTGLRPPVVPSLCSSPFRYAYPSPRPQVLVDACDPLRCPPFRQKAVEGLVRGLMQLSAHAGLSMAELRTLYPRYEQSDLVQHPAIVLLPYQVSVMSFFERRAMGIPIFVPSLDLLAEWHMKYGLVYERRFDWATVTASPAHTSTSLSPSKRHLTPRPGLDMAPRAPRLGLVEAP